MSDSPNKGKPQDPNQQQGKSAYPLDGYSVQPKSDASGGDNDKNPYYQSAAPTIQMPKGGGALKGIDEKFTVNAINGTAAMQVGLPLSPSRGGFTPNLSLSYNSGSGNTEFGLGWSLSLPSIQRKTDKMLPLYDDANESDVFLLAGAEDLLPMLDISNVVIEHDYPTGSPEYRIKQYRPRIEGLFARIEYIKKLGTTDTWWRVTTKDNITTYYGLTAQGRIANPESPRQIFKWLPELVIDNKGNVQVYNYIQEDLVNVPAVIHESKRLAGDSPFTNTYLKSVWYCNQTPSYIFPLTIDNTHPPTDPNDDSDAVYIEAIFEPLLPSDPDDFLMIAVLDYGDHDSDFPFVLPISNSWQCRKDPFSDFHAGFEIRTYRKCRRILMFHDFTELDSNSTGAHVLVRSLDISYQNDTNTADNYVEVDFITSFMQKGYTQTSSSLYYSESLPPLTLSYFPLNWNNNIQTVSSENSVHAPQGLTGNYQWIDFWGEGLPGILSEQGDSWWYKSNLGNGTFSPAEVIAPKPSFTGLGGGGLQWQDLDADGRRQVVSQMPKGFFELDDDQEWQPFTAFKNELNLDFNSPYNKMLDLNGDGKADVLVTEDRVWTWYKNEGKEGYEMGGAFSPGWDEEKGPRLILNDEVQRIFLADMNGDGMTDLVRITNGEVCYWPNKGYGQFGAKVTMSNSPVFANGSDFNPIYLQLSDITGTGAADIIYLGDNECTVYINLAGNAWSGGTFINPLPAINPYSKLAVMDFLGNGTGCLVWSSPLPQHSRQPMQYIDLMGGNKPYLMYSYSNNLGKTIEVQYRSSTQYYLDDKKNGTPWATRLPFPVQCIKKIITSDSVSQTTYTQTYDYHHGYYDHEEREFRGFGRVDTYDLDKAAIDNNTSNDLNQAMVFTKSWYHTGAWMRESTLIKQFEKEYYQQSSWWDTPPHITIVGVGLTPVEKRQAYRALKGLPLRQEVYALDGNTIPYSVSSFAYETQMVQPQNNNRFASFFTHQQQSVAWTTERNATDARVMQQFTLEIDDYGNVLQSAEVAYPRTNIPTTLPLEVQDAQTKLFVTYNQNIFTNDINTIQHYHLRLAYEQKGYELHGITAPSISFLTIEDILSYVAAASFIDYSDTPSGTGTPELRLLSNSKVLFLPNDLSTPLPFGSLEFLAIPYQQYTLAFTQNTINANYNTGATRVTSVELSEAKYIQLPSDINNWWIQSGTIQFSSFPHMDFYSPISFTDPWANVTTVTYWSSYFLIPQSTTDSIGNIHTVDTYDWRHFAPTQVTDANNNVSRMVYNCLGMPVAMAVLGKNTAGISDADDLIGLDPDADHSIQESFWGYVSTNDNNILTEAATLLNHATWRCVCDHSSAPVKVAMIAREEHYIDNPSSNLLLRITYTDGFGRVAMHKVLAETI